MLKCNRCGSRKSDLENGDIFIVALCEQPAPEVKIEGHMIIDWSVVQETGFVTCEPCMLAAVDLLEAFYGGSKE